MERCRVSDFGQKQIPKAAREMIVLNKKLFKTKIYLSDLNSSESNSTRTASTIC